MLQSLIDDALTELRDAFEGDPDSVNEDWIWETADGWVPIYTSDLLECCQQDFSLFCSLPDSYAENAAPDRLVAINIFERIQKELRDEWERLQEEQENA